MNRRQCLKTAALGMAATTLTGAAAAPGQLHVDMEVDPVREKQMQSDYRTHFRPAITRQPGFVEVKLLKLVSTVAGPAPGSFTYRLLISFRTEDQRKAWVATPEHQKVWPMIEKSLKGDKYSAVLYEVI